jgi:hypothetical protein
MTKFLQEFSVATSPGPTRYVLADGYIATPKSIAEVARLEIVYCFEDEDICVCRAEPGSDIDRLATEEIAPVYRIGERGQLAVPTGRVFVRFEEATTLVSRQHEIERAGFVIQQALSYAPQAGWLLPQSGHIADALQDFPKLTQLPGILAVEPQLLMQREMR